MAATVYSNDYQELTQHVKHIYFQMQMWGGLNAGYDYWIDNVWCLILQRSNIPWVTFCLPVLDLAPVDFPEHSLLLHWQEGNYVIDQLPVKWLGRI